MSRRTDLLQSLIKSEKFGDEKSQEQKFMTATAELILTDLINIAMGGVERTGAGTLIINLVNDSSIYMSGDDIQKDLVLAESLEDDESIKMMRQLMEQVDENDWSTHVLITLISNAGTRTFSVEAGGSQESLRALASEFSG
jgi:hypothetical protein